MPTTPTTTPPQDRPVHRPAERARRIHIPVMDAENVSDLQRRNLFAAKRRVDNAFRKLYEAQMLLSDVPDGVLTQAQAAQLHLRAAVRAAQAATNELNPRLRSAKDDLPASAPLPPPVKRPVGRPRKNPVPSSLSSPATAPDDAGALAV